MIKGNLSSFSLGEIFQSLAVNNHTGTMKIVEVDGSEKYLYFSQGEICLFSDKSAPGLRLGEILFRQGKISREQLDAALADQKTSRDKIGQILVKSYGLSPDDIQDALVTKIYDEVYDLFLLQEAEFEFYVDHFPEEVFEVYADNVRISINTYSVVMEGLRVADEWKLISRRIQTFNEIYVLSSPGEKRFEDPHDQALYELVDGKTPLRRLFDAFPGSRFDCCKTMFGFLGAGLVRPLALEECRLAGVEAGRAGDLQSAFEFLQFAVEMQPDRPEPVVLIGEILARMGRDKDARESHLKAIRLFATTANHVEVVRLGEPLLPYIEKDEHALKTVLESAVHTKKLQVIERAGDAFATLQAAKGQKAIAAEILQLVCDYLPKNSERKLRAATLLKESGAIDDAVTLMEDVAESLVGRAKIAEKIRVLRGIYELAPNRQDVKQQITMLLEEQERWEHQKKRRFTIAGVAIIALLILAFIPVLYEIKAREIISHAERLETISQASGDYAMAKQTYGEIVSRYGWSLQAGKAREAIERIETIERVMAQTVQNQAAQVENQQEERIRKLKSTVTRLLEVASQLEGRGDHRGAFNVLIQLAEDFPEFPQAKLVPLPITLTSTPPGCTASVNGKELGQTPVVIHEPVGTQITVSLTRSGCEPLLRNVTVGSSWNIHFKLDLRPLAEFKLTGPAHQRIDAYEGDLFIPSRDGFFYSINPGTQTINWRRQVGKYGDLASNPWYGTSEIILGNVVGEVAVVSREDGRSRWRRRLKSSVIAAPAVSMDGRWVAVGDVNGNVFLLGNQDGKVAATFRAENEILHAPVFWNDALLVPAQDNTLYTLSLPGLELLARHYFEHDIATELTRHHEYVIFATEEGTLHAYNILERRTSWQSDLGARASTSALVHGGEVLVGTENGRLVSIDAATGRRSWELPLSNSGLGAVLIYQGVAYLGTDEGELMGVPLGARERSWLHRLDDSVELAPIVIDDRLYFATSAGRIVVMEIFR